MPEAMTQDGVRRQWFGWWLGLIVLAAGVLFAGWHYQSWWPGAIPSPTRELSPADLIRLGAKARGATHYTVFVAHQRARVMSFAVAQRGTPAWSGLPGGHDSRGQRQHHDPR